MNSSEREQRSRGGGDHPSDRLFIKVVLPQQGKERPVTGGGGGDEPLRPVDDKLRSSLGARVAVLQDAILPSAREVGSVPVRVQLIPKAFAKSHRPNTIFAEDSCPIVGAGKIGELFVRATPEGLARVEERIRTGKSKQLVKELSTIETIEAVTPEYRRNGISPGDILRRCPLVDKSFAVRVQLFDVANAASQDQLVANFRKACQKAGATIRVRGYSAASNALEVMCHAEKDLDQLSRVVGVRSLRAMPLVRTIRPRVLRAKPPTVKFPAPTGPLSSYPVVAVVDSGIGPSGNGALNQWVIGRESTVAPEYRNEWHGTFVGGLIAFGRLLNPSLAAVDSSPCAIFDLGVIPNDDPDAGSIDGLLESEFLEALEAALKRHANEVKVWNLSLGTDEVCSLDTFSPFAVELDRMQEQYRVSFVVSAGNYEQPPLLAYPRPGSTLDVGRITAPADSVLAVTVGSVAHAPHGPKDPKIGEPSAFSRHGPGANYVIKPDLVHFGGCCSLDGTKSKGVISLGNAGLEEASGTSFAAPLVSRVLASVYHQVTPSPSPELARAIITHHARDPRTGGRVKDSDEHVVGFGLPAPPPICLECSPWQSTLVFEDVLRPGYFLEWDDFPYPQCLQAGGKYFGEIWMTIAFTPTRGAEWGTEYCGTHIDAHFGVYHDTRNRKTGVVTEKFAGQVPPEHKNPGILFESYQVEKLRKWSPTRTYHGNLGETGVRGKRWRLKVQLLCRHGLDKQSGYSQPFALILTIGDPNRTAPVYDDMAVSIRSRLKVQSLQLRPQVRVQGTT